MAGQENAKKGKGKKVLMVVLIVAAVFVVLGVAGSLMDDSDSSSSNTQSTTRSSAEQKTEKPKEEMTAAQKNAYQAAQDYLDFSAFSRQGLIDQLSSESGDGYKKKDAEFAVSKLEKEGRVDWNEQAVKSAKTYLETSSFSKDGLIEQLESEYGEQFTHEQAVYGADKAYK
ncbi:MAG: Ltp family lipoprotein [Anaerovoracaceae bacterium]|jgi:uncharacterized membrane protein